MSDAALRLVRLSLTEFRGYQTLTWFPGSRISVLFGPNGSGKTNLLEAVSLLMPGRGLRNARTAELARRGPAATGRWGIAGRFTVAGATFDIGTGSPPEGPSDRRVFRLDGTTPRSQAEIATRVTAVWLTPAMDRLFTESPAGRRRFLDRLVWALEPTHAREVAAHDAAMSGRNRLLAQGSTDLSWIAGLEETMARHAVAVTGARMALAARLDALLSSGVVVGFPPVRVTLHCRIAEQLAAAPAAAVEDSLRRALAENRVRDAAAGSAAVGAHRCDFVVTDAVTGLSAGLASTGEQKSILLGIILGHAALIGDMRGMAPLLLLDEPAVHLDPDRRQALFAALNRLSGQTLLTGVDAEPFLPIAGMAEGLQTGNGVLMRDARFSTPAAPAGPVRQAL